MSKEAGFRKNSQDAMQEQNSQLNRRKFLGSIGVMDSGETKPDEDPVNGGIIDSRLVQKMEIV